MIKKCFLTYNFFTFQISVCDQCGKAFKNSHKLKLHVASFHEGKKSYVCNLCSKAYFSGLGLRQHVKTIHEKLRFQCDSCEKSFSILASLKDHIKIKHEKEDDEPSFSCELCGKAYQRRQGLDNHRNVAHKGKRIECRHCDKAYTCHKSLKKHMEKFHLDIAVANKIQWPVIRDNPLYNKLPLPDDVPKPESEDAGRTALSLYESEGRPGRGRPAFMEEGLRERSIPHFLGT